MGLAGHGDAVSVHLPQRGLSRIGDLALSPLTFGADRQGFAATWKPSSTPLGCGTADLGVRAFQLGLRTSFFFPCFSLAPMRRYLS